LVNFNVNLTLVTTHLKPRKQIYCKYYDVSVNCEEEVAWQKEYKTLDVKTDVESHHKASAVERCGYVKEEVFLKKSAEIRSRL